MWKYCLFIEYSGDIR